MTTETGRTGLSASELDRLTRKYDWLEPAWRDSPAPDDEPACNVTTALDMVGEIRSLIAAAREPLDVERLASAIALFVDLPQSFDSFLQLAEFVAAKYVALEPTP